MSPSLTNALAWALLLAPLGRTQAQIQVPPQVCVTGAQVPNMWSIAPLSVSHLSGLSTAATVAFSVTNLKTNETEALSCNLQAGYKCDIKGTPKNKALNIFLQLNLVALFSFEETLACAGKTASFWGNAEMEIECDDAATSCKGVGGPAVVNATVEILP